MTIRRISLLPVAALLAASAIGQFPPPDAPSAQSDEKYSPPALWPKSAKPFQPGVAIDWKAPAVLVQGRVALREGPLEFVACFAGKEHESLVRLEASAMSIYMALGLIGVNAGAPPRWNETMGEFQSATGDMVDVAFVVNGVEASAWDWMIDAEYGRSPLSRPWVFAGSVKLDDGSLAADRSGVGIAIVDFGDSLLSLSEARPSRNAELWAVANATRVPPQGAALLVRLAPAHATQRKFSLDDRGDLRVDDQIVSSVEFADFLRLQKRLGGAAPTIEAASALASDVRAVRSRLAQLGVDADAARWKLRR